MIKINLSPSTGRRGGAGFRLPALGLSLGLVFVVLYLVAVGGLGWWWWSLSDEKAKLTSEIDRTQREVASLKAVIGQGANVKSDVTDMRKRVEVIEALTRDQGRAILMFDAFADMLPRDLWITGLEEKNAVLKVSGTAFSPTAVADFMANLRASGKFKDVDIVISRQDLSKTPRLVTFEVTCRFEG